ncbi:hypothetical protein FRC07_014932 [Ceratobasidium sp. 392]|nr:hypothetical protein FRC07_014932 [Ceratobasidium sp. 392]
MDDWYKYKNGQDEISALKKEVAALKRAQAEGVDLLPTKRQYNATSPLLVCLIDGDGCIFNKHLLVLGTEGGRRAASELRHRIISDYGSNHDLLINVFFNREGLARVLKSHFGIQPGTFSAFITGFNRASPLASMLDVGAGKEAADAKIRGKFISPIFKHTVDP